VRHLSASWVAYGANLVVMFFLSPFVVHRLGDHAYGLWSLIVSVTGYLGLIEVGMRASLGRFINCAFGRGDARGVSDTLNAATAFFVLLAVPLFVSAGVVSMALPSLVAEIPQDLVAPSQTALWLATLNVWLAFFSASLTQVITARERFDLVAGINVVVLLTRTVGTILALEAGGRLPELAGVQAGSTAAAVVGTYLVARRVFPALQVRPWQARWDILRELIGFGLWAFLGRVGMQLLYWTDTIVVAVFFGPKQVALYAIAGMLVMRAKGLVNECGHIFGPRVIQTAARGEWSALRWQLCRASIVVIAIAVPVLGSLIVLGRQFLGLWIGRDYETGYGVVVILALSQFAAVAAMMGTPVFAALHRVRFAGLITVAQAIVNVALTLVFVGIWKMGMEGVAWGTFFPRVVFSSIAGVAAMRWVALPLARFAREVVLAWIVLAGTFAAGALLISALPVATGWAGLFGKLTAMVVLYAPVAVLCLLRRRESLPAGKSDVGEAEPVTGHLGLVRGS